MNPFPHYYNAAVSAACDGDLSTSITGVDALQVASPPEFGGPGGRWSPETLLAPAAEKTGHEIKIPSAMSDEDLVNALAQYLDLEPLEKQALLEKDNLRVRAEALVELLEMKVLMARTPNASHVAH